MTHMVSRTAFDTVFRAGALEVHPDAGRAPKAKIHLRTGGIPTQRSANEFARGD